MGRGAGFGQSKERGRLGLRVIWSSWGCGGDGNRLCLKLKMLKLEDVGPSIVFSILSCMFDIFQKKIDPVTAWPGWDFLACLAA